MRTGTGTKQMGPIWELVPEPRNSVTGTETLLSGPELVGTETGFIQSQDVFLIVGTKWCHWFN